MSSRLTRRKTYFCAHGSRSGTGQKECDAKFEAIKRLPDVECPVCGAYDNDWPDRQGLCFDCFCAAYCWIIDNVSDEMPCPKFGEVQRMLEAIVHDGGRFPKLAAAVRGIRERRKEEEERQAAIVKAEMARIKRDYWRRHEAEMREIEREREAARDEKNYDKQRRYRETHRAEIREKARKYREEHREQRRKYREEHREQIKERMHQYYLEHKDQCKAAVRRWRERRLQDKTA